MNNGLIAFAWKSVVSNLKETGLAIGAVSLGVATVVILLSLGFGLYDVVVQQVATSSATTISVSAEGGQGPPGTNAVTPLSTDLENVLERVRGVETVAGRLIRTTTISVDDESSTVFVTSLPEDREKRRYVLENFNYNILDGRNLRRGDTGALIGSSLATEPVVDRPLMLRETVTINNKPVRIVGELEEAGSFRVDNTMVVMEDFARDLFNSTGSYDIYVVQPEQSANVNEVVTRLERVLRSERDVDEGEEDFDTSTQQQVLQRIGTVLTIIVTFISSIGGISIVLGALTMANTMFTLVSEREYEIGIMKSFGATNGQIRSLYLLESGVIGLFAGIAGTLLGVIITPILVSTLGPLLDTSFLAYRIPLELVIAVPLGSLIVGMVSGYVPATQAAKKDVVEALR